MYFVELSSTQYVQPDDITGCEIVKKEDDMWYVQWAVDEDQVESEAFPGKLAAKNYIGRIQEEMKVILDEQPKFD